jgi:cytoplasmic iron level regulating protein YaaA (DUF328/UPF0246 family)
MLIILPPSESKRLPPGNGRPVDLDALSFPELAAVRTQVLDALVATSARPDAFKRLQVGPSIAAQVAQNAFVRELPAVPVLDVYSGPLHAGLDAGTFSPAAIERARRSLVVASPLWGLLRPTDQIPPYRLHICSRLVGMDWLKPTWRPVLGPVLADAAGPDGIVIDLRSPNYQAMGMPTGIGDRTINLHVDMKSAGGGGIGVVVAKQMRGEAARLLLDSGEEPEDPAALARVLADRWPVRLQEPERPGKPWTMTLAADD